MKLNLSFAAVALSLAVASGAGAQSVNYTVNPSTGAISELLIENDPTGMNWLLSVDGSQYENIGEDYGWGLGYVSIDGVKHWWNKPASGNSHAYMAGDVLVSVERQSIGGDLREVYTFTNVGRRDVRMSDIGIFTPFNDNYPNSAECVNRRCHAHIWDGGDCAFVSAVRMGGFGPHLGLVVTEAALMATTFGSAEPPSTTRRFAA